MLDALTTAMRAGQRGIFSSIFWGVAPYVLPKALDLVGSAGKALLRKWKPHSFMPGVWTGLEDFFQRPDVQDAFHMAAYAGARTADAYFRDNARQNAALELYKLDRERVRERNKRISADNQ